MMMNLPLAYFGNERYVVGGSNAPFFLTIRPYAKEWNDTIRPLEGLTMNHLITPSPIHLWFKCIDNTARVYFAIEDMQRKQHNELRVNTLEVHVLEAELKKRFNLLIDGNDTSFDATGKHRTPSLTSLDIFRSEPIDVRAKPRNESIHIRFLQFCQYVAFPMSQCKYDSNIMEISTSNNRSIHGISSISSSNKNSIVSSKDAVTAQQHPYIRPVDDGLLLATIQPYSHEWLTAMRPWERVDLASGLITGNLVTPSPFHFVFRCVDGVVRIYFTVEDMTNRPGATQPEGGELRIPLPVMRSRIRLYINGVKTPYRVWHGGADVQVDVSAYARNQSLRIQIGSLRLPEVETLWAQYITFPLDSCSATPPSRWTEDKESSSIGSSSSSSSSSRSSSTGVEGDDTISFFAIVLVSALTVAALALLVSSFCRCKVYSDRDRMCVRVGALALLAVNSTALLVLLVDARRFIRPAPLSTPPHSPVYANNDIVVHLHTFDQYTNVPSRQNALLIEGLAKHMVYHRCALNVTRYEVVVQEDHLPQYLGNRHLAAFAKEGWLTFLVKGHRPARLNYQNCNWQGLYENMALLRHWRTKAHVMFWNADEYLVYDQRHSTASFRAELLRHAANGFRRYMTFCAAGNSACAANGEPELHNFSLSHNTYVLGHKLRDLKLLVNPDFVGCMIMHWAGCGTGLIPDESQLHYSGVSDVRMIKNTSAYIAHFENLFHARWSRTDASQRWLFAQMSSTNATVDRLRSPVVARCDPHVIHNFGTPSPSAPPSHR